MFICVMLGGAFVGTSTFVVTGGPLPPLDGSSNSTTGDREGNPPSGIGGGGGASSSSMIGLVGVKLGLGGGGGIVLAVVVAPPRSGLGGGGGTGPFQALAASDTIVLAGAGGGAGCTGVAVGVASLDPNTLKGGCVLGYDDSNGVVIGGGGALG